MARVVEELEPILVSELKGVDRYIRLIQEGLFEVVQGQRGTARLAKIEGLNIAGKTGTAQVVKVAQYRHLKEEDIPYKYRDHAWFTCYAPAEKPEIAVTVLVEHGLHGSSGAAPIAKAVLESYFADRLAIDEESMIKRRNSDAGSLSISRVDRFSFDHARYYLGRTIVWYNDSHR
jgi:penicillin-binding protein 2